MPIANRTLDASEQRKIFQVQTGLLATGATGTIAVVPWPCILDAGEMVAFGLSSTPNYSLVVNRFIVGTGVTAITIAVGTSNVPNAFGTSGPSAMVLPAAGSTLLQLLPNDVLMYQSGVANSAATGFAMSISLKPIQDIKVVHGQI